jgi:thiol-disulfide isomerase/thioredoxin
MKTPILKNLILLVLIVGIISACSKKEDFTGQDDEQIEEIQIGLTFRQASLRNQQVDFHVFDDEGNEITENVSFYVDGNLLADGTFLSPVEGTFEVFAEYELNGIVYTTDVETFDVVIPKRKVVLEDYTGTWCGYCPSLDAAIREVALLTDDITAVAIHNNDDLALAIEPTIREEFGVFGFPSGRINRTTTWGSALNFPASVVTDLAGNATNMAISITSQVSNSSLLVKINVASEDDIQDKKLVVYLLEDGILRDQTNYFNNDETSPYFGLGNPIPDFELDHVLRATLSDAFGDPITNTTALTDFEANYSFDIPADYVVNNLSIVVMVVEEDNSAVNSQHVKVNESVFYE